MVAQSSISIRRQVISTVTKSHSPDSDEFLVQQARAGNYDAFEVLFERHRTLVFRFVYGMIPIRDAAEDITQDAFVKAYNSLGNYRDEAKFTTWLLRIAGNLCTDHARMVSRRSNLEKREAGGGLDWMTIGSVVDPVEEMEQDRRKGVLRKAIMALPDHHKQVIVMRDLEEMEYTDIASALNCTVGGAKLRVLRARRALKDRVEGLLNETI